MGRSASRCVLAKDACARGRAYRRVRSRNLAQVLEALRGEWEGEIVVEEAEADGVCMCVFAPAIAHIGSQLHDMEDDLVILAWEVGR
ncbi:hypothetical protein KSX_55640 [Ktedonospora formicarum]|uniref:Uncharacterized protein n=1 Tax=Ktedonospora formicarum TaxID=2778364 RepID=A0A8J3I4L8_9CHLR|nr:hypothetical protein KSX_55640 [Ktedonospora formicarum]